MSQIIDQLELNQTYFVQFVLFIFVFLILSRLYFKPFLKLFQARHQRTVEDREAAEKLLDDANRKWSDYQAKLTRAREDAKLEYEKILAEARAKEAEILDKARKEAKQIAQEAAASVQAQRAALKKDLEKDVESLAEQISERLAGKN